MTPRNHRVIIKRRATGEDAAGQPLTGFVEFTRRWASILYANGKSTIQADAASSAPKVSIRILWCADMEPGLRVEHGGVVYEVLQVLPDLAGRKHVDLVCEVV